MMNTQPTGHNARSGRSPRNGGRRRKPYTAQGDNRRRSGGGRRGSNNSARSSRGAHGKHARGNPVRQAQGRPTRQAQGRPTRQARGRQQIHPSRFVNRAEPSVEEAAYTPSNQFSDFALNEKLKANIAKKGYTTPTPIQDKIIPHVLDGSDVVGIADTGTGKTAAFLLPLLSRVLVDRSKRVLIITPTRELAQQIEEELTSFATGLSIFSTSCVGGAPIGKQINRLRRHTNQFVIGTPGRLNDLVERDVLDLSAFSTLVLDEADRMLDMGFIDDMKKVMKAMPDTRHTLFFSATMSDQITKLVNTLLTDPVTVSVKTGDTSKQVDQDVVRVNGQDKFTVLTELLARPECEKVLIFGETKRGVEKLAKQLSRSDIKADAIHGNKSQSQRERALKRFKDGVVDVLVATDVAARGFDIRGVSHVINYDTPQTYDDYVHRVGRTGRAGKTGKALTFVG